MPFHDIIDVVRSKADESFLQQIREVGGAEEEGRDLVVFLDRNNTPDVWKDISNSISMVANLNTQSVVLVPN